MLGNGDYSDILRTVGDGVQVEQLADFHIDYLAYGARIIILKKAKWKSLKYPSTLAKSVNQ